MRYLKNPLSDYPIEKIFVKRNWIEEVEAHLKSEDDLPIVLVGGTGIGKTHIVQSMAQKLGYLMFPFVLSQVNDISDFLGYASRVGDRIQFLLLDEWYKIITENEKFKNGQKYTKCVLFFDEYNRASPDVAYSIFTIFSEYRIKNYQLYPQVVRIIGSINPIGEYATATDDLAFKARVGYLIVDWEIDTWVEWITNHPTLYYLKDLVKFIRDNKVLLKTDIAPEARKEYDGILTPRSWTRFMNAVHHRKGISEQLAIGLIGQKAVLELKEYLKSFIVYTLDNIKDNMDEFIDKIKRYVQNKDHKNITKLLDDIATKSDFREDNYKDLIKLVRKLIEIKIPREILHAFLVKLNNDKFLNTRTNRDEIFNSLMYSFENNLNYYVDLDEETFDNEALKFLKSKFPDFDINDPPIIEDDNKYLELVVPFLKKMIDKYKRPL